MASSDEWLAALRHWYGEQVVESRRACFHCLARGKVLHQWHKEFNGWPPNELPECHAFDHCSLWRIGNEPLVFVTQPYHVRHEDLRMLLDFCEQHELELEIEENAAFHNPGSCPGVVIWHRVTREKYARDPWRREEDE